MIKLAVFDIDDTLTQGPPIWEQMYHEVGKWESHGKLYLEQYQKGRINWEEFTRLDAWQYRGPHESVVVEAAKKLKYVKGLKELMAHLKGQGIKTAFISATLYQFARWLADKHEVDYCYANPLLTDKKGHLTGGIEIKVFATGKHLAMKELQRISGIKKKNILAVGDSALDLSMFREAGLCACPSHAPQEVKKRAHHVLKGNDLSSLEELIRAKSHKHCARSK